MKTIIEMAREADVYCTTRQPTLDAMLERFAALVRADERKRSWVGLTEQDVANLSDFAYANDEEFVRNVEAKLKELNS